MGAHSRPDAEITDTEQSYAITRGRQLVAEYDSPLGPDDLPAWEGSAAAILRELTR